jgi:hypothetical protein
MISPAPMPCETRRNGIESLNYHLYTDPRMTVRGIRVRALQMKQTVGLGAITIDGLKRLRTETRHRTDGTGWRRSPASSRPWRSS